jgi:hypothetical protein
VPPGFQVYVDAPLAFKVAELPAQIFVADGETDKVGKEFTVILTVCVLLQLNEFVPLTVYVVVTVGETTTLLPVKAPGFHVYVDAPFAVRLLDWPAQIVGLEATAVTVGKGFTIRFRICEEIQMPFAPVTEYVVVIVGLTITLLAVKAPGFQV